MYDALILEKVERSLAVMSYANFKREDVKTPIGENRFILSYIIYFV